MNYIEISILIFSLLCALILSFFSFRDYKEKDFELYDLDAKYIQFTDEDNEIPIVWYSLDPDNKSLNPIIKDKINNNYQFNFSIEQNVTNSTQLNNFLNYIHNLIQTKYGYSIDITNDAYFISITDNDQTYDNPVGWIQNPTRFDITIKKESDYSTFIQATKKGNQMIRNDLIHKKTTFENYEKWIEEMKKTYNEPKSTVYWYDLENNRIQVDKKVWEAMNEKIYTVFLE